MNFIAIYDMAVNLGRITVESNDCFVMLTVNF